MSEDTEFVFCGGDVDPNDRSHDSRIIAVDDGIIKWLERRARRRTDAADTERKAARGR